MTNSSVKIDEAIDKIEKILTEYDFAACMHIFGGEASCRVMKFDSSFSVIKAVEGGVFLESNVNEEPFNGDAQKQHLHHFYTLLMIKFFINSSRMAVLALDPMYRKFAEEFEIDDKDVQIAFEGIFKGILH